MASKKKTKPKSIINRRARFDYNIGDSYTVGMELTGAETKALRLGHGQLTGSYVTVKGGELWLLNATINGTGSIRIGESEQTRTRRLLANRKEIEKMIEAKTQGKTIIPLELLTQGRFIKLKIALAQGKKRYDKRQTIKKREENRQINRNLNR